jgi:hypothetical protein
MKRERKRQRQKIRRKAFGMTEDLEKDRNNAHAK